MTGCKLNVLTRILNQASPLHLMARDLSWIEITAGDLAFYHESRKSCTDQFAPAAHVPSHEQIRQWKLISKGKKQTFLAITPKMREEAEKYKDRVILNSFFLASPADAESFYTKVNFT